MRVFGATFYAVVGPCEGLCKVFANLFVELFVLLLGHIFLGACPEGRGFVDGFPFASFDHAAGLTAFAFVLANQFAIFPLFFFHQDGQADVV